jgi:hypothetical protein
MIFWREIVIFHTKHPKKISRLPPLGAIFLCAPPNLKSWIRPIETKYSFIEAGHYKPTNCTPHQNVAIIVFVYKEVGSEIQFKIFLNNVPGSAPENDNN